MQRLRPSPIEQAPRPGRPRGRVISSHYKERYQRTKRRVGMQRGPSVARVDLARDLVTAFGHMLTKDQLFSLAGPASHLAA